MRTLLALLLLISSSLSALAGTQILAVLNRTSYLVSYVEAFATDSDAPRSYIMEKKEIYEGERQIFFIEDTYNYCDFVVVLHMHDKAMSCTTLSGVAGDAAKLRSIMQQ